MKKIDSVGSHAHPEVTERIRAYLAREVRKGRTYFRASHMSVDLALTTNIIGVRMGIMERCGAAGIRVSKFSDKIWRVEICHECRDVRETPQGV